jgi:hypothetical protein
MRLIDFKPKTKTARVVSAFIDTAPPVFNEYYDLDTCINSTWVMCKVLEEFDVEVTPLAATAFAFNAAFMERTKELGRFPNGKVEIDEWYEANGSHSVGIVRGKSLRPETWEGGHLVGFVKEWLIDPSARQFCRPKYRIYVPDILVAEVTTAFLTGDERAALPLKGGGMILYEAFPDDDSFLRTPGWIQGNGNEEVAAIILKAMKKLRLR